MPRWPLPASSVALLILSPEGLGALKAVLNNQVQRAMNLFFGSVLATISLTVPVVTLIAFMTGNELQFALGAPDDCDGSVTAAVSDFVLNRAHQCAQRRGAYGAVCSVSDDDICVVLSWCGLMPSPNPSPTGEGEKNPPKRVFINCWYPARRNSSPRSSISFDLFSGTAPVCPAAAQTDRRIFAFADRVRFNEQTRRGRSPYRRAPVRSPAHDGHRRGTKWVAALQRVGHVKRSPGDWLETFSSR